MKYLHVFIIYMELHQHNALKDPKNALVMKAAKESNKMDLADVMKVDCVLLTLLSTILLACQENQCNVMVNLRTLRVPESFSICFDLKVNPIKGTFNNHTWSGCMSKNLSQKWDTAKCRSRI